MIYLMLTDTAGGAHWFLRLRAAGIHLSAVSSLQGRGSHSISETARLGVDLTGTRGHDLHHWSDGRAVDSVGGHRAAAAHRVRCGDV